MFFQKVVHVEFQNNATSSLDIKRCFATLSFTISLPLDYIFVVGLNQWYSEREPLEKGFYLNLPEK